MQWGDRPTNLSPCTKLPGSFGCANNKASCRWRDGAGNPVVAFVDKNAKGVYMAYPSLSESNTVELSNGIRGLLQSFLLAPQSLTASSVRIGVDEQNDALWVIAGKRAMVLRKPSLVDGNRQWELYSYGFAFDINAISFTGAQSLKAQLSDGAIEEIERVHSTGVEYDTDAGTAITGAYWKSRTIPTSWTCLGKVFCDKNSTHEKVKIEAVSYPREVSSSVVVPDGKDWTSFKPSQSGTDHEITVYIPEDSEGIAGVDVQINPAGRKW
jgi:hypothetical protein